jgi:SAM-dependent methyltransferase
MAGGFKRALFFRHSIGNHMLTFLCDLASDLNLTDMETCYKMVRTDLFRSIPLESRDFRIEPELTIKLAKRGARVFEVPISYSGRTYQEGKKIGWKDGVKALLAIIKFGASDRICKPDKYGSEVSIRLNGAPEYNRWMADSLRPYLGKRVLELGAGFGSLTLMLIPRTRYVACDTNPLFVRELQKLTDTRPYLEVAEIDPADPNSLPKDASFDSVLCQNVLEHVEDDSAALNSIRNALETGGRAIILVPQNPKLFGALDDALGHRRRYTREQLMHLAEKCGFRCVQILPFNRPSSLIWWLNSRVLRRKQLTYFQVRMLNFLAPVFKTIDPLLPVTPLSLIAVFEKS